MRIDFTGRLSDEKEIRAGFIGCGSHSFRNIYPVFQFAPVDLVAVCDLSIEKAQAFARKFGAVNAYDNYREMLKKENLDAVFIVTGYNEAGRPLYPDIAIDCMNAGCHVWMEKPPAADVGDIERMQAAADRNNRLAMVGFKKMFLPINEKAKELAEAEEFGKISLVLLQYPQHVPTKEQFDEYIMTKSNLWEVRSFLDHICHPVSLLLFLMGMPSTLYYERSESGAATAAFSFPSGAIASLALTGGAASNCGMERTTIISNKGKHIVVDNNIRLSYHQTPPELHYGRSVSYFTGTPHQVSAVWEPEFSLGQLYNKGLFLLGYYNEVNEFTRAILEGRKPSKGTLEHAWQVTRIFEKFAEGPGNLIKID